MNTVLLIKLFKKLGTFPELSALLQVETQIKGCPLKINSLS